MRVRSSNACSAPFRSMRAKCARRVTPSSHGSSQVSSEAIRAASEMSGHAPSGSCSRAKATRARHCVAPAARAARPARAHGCLRAARRAPRSSGSASGSSRSSSAPRCAWRRAITASERASQVTISRSSMAAAKCATSNRTSSGAGVVRFDPTRVAAQVVTGIGFLGAGAILRYGINIRGLTTAASIWVTASIGVAVALGFWTPACSPPHWH